MSEAPPNPHDPHTRINKEYEDPHYHDEDLDIYQDDSPREGRPPPKRKPLRKPPPLPRRHYED